MFSYEFYQALLELVDGGTQKVVATRFDPTARYLPITVTVQEKTTGKQYQIDVTEVPKG